MATISIDFTRSEWITSNQRDHWAVKAKKTRRLRALAFYEARRHASVPTPAKVTATISTPTQIRFDPHNAGPSVKALIDGCVDAGIIPDDNHEHLAEVAFVRGTHTGVTGQYRITLHFETVT